jgi:hypothetical protein
MALIIMPPIVPKRSAFGANSYGQGQLGHQQKVSGIYAEYHLLVHPGFERSTPESSWFARATIKNRLLFVANSMQNLIRN